MTFDRRRPKPAAYHLMSSQEKQLYAQKQVREAAVLCPGGCGLQLMPVDLRNHLEARCTGPADPGPTAKWLTWREALALDRAMHGMQLSRWARPDRYGVIKVRSRGERGDQQYLERDLLVAIAAERVRRRR